MNAKPYWHILYPPELQKARLTITRMTLKLIKSLNLRYTQWVGLSLVYLRGSQFSKQSNKLIISKQKHYIGTCLLKSITWQYWHGSQCCFCWAVLVVILVSKLTPITGMPWQNLYCSSRARGQEGSQLLNKSVGGPALAFTMVALPMYLLHS